MSEKELQEFWEWCGFTQNKQNYGRGSEYLWNYPDSQVGTLPSLDLNNLFKYAVPKLMELGSTIMCESVKEQDLVLYEWCFTRGKNEGIWEGTDKDPALALYQAIQKTRKQ